MHKARTALVAGAFVAATLVAIAQQPAATPPQGEPGVAQGRGQRGGRGPGRGAPRVRKTILAWADTRNGQAQHDSVGMRSR